MFEAIDLIDTEFVMQACDDEFYIPSALNSTVSDITSSIISSIVGVHNPVVSVEQSTALLEKDRNTDIHSHSVK